MPVTINDITTGAVNGTGTFDKLMQVVKLHLQEEYEAERIRDEDYASVYLGSMQSVIGQALQFELGKAQTELIEQQILVAQQQVLATQQQVLKTQAEVALIDQKRTTEVAQTTDLATGIVGKQQTLYTRQADGFLRDAEQKAAKIYADGYSVQRSTDSALAPPTELQSAQISAVLTALKTGAGIP